MEEPKKTSLFNSDIDQLYRVLVQIRDIEKRMVSLRWNFWRGVVYGLGFFVGSVLLTALLVYGLSNLNLNGDSSFGRFIQNIAEQVQQFRN